MLVSLSKSGHGVALNIWNSGWKSTCGGSRLPAVNSSSSATLNRQLYRLTANAIVLENNRMRTIDGMTMNIVFVNVLGHVALRPRVA